MAMGTCLPGPCTGTGKCTIVTDAPEREYLDRSQ
jgi:hypothetical protein